MQLSCMSMAISDARRRDVVEGVWEEKEIWIWKSWFDGSLWQKLWDIRAMDKDRSGM